MSWYLYDKRVDFASLLGKTLTSVEVEHDTIRFSTDDGAVYLMYHSQDCCESVSVESVVGDVSDLIGNPLLLAEEVNNGDRPADVPAPEYVDSETWTFYKLATIKGYIDIRWHGESNGYYSESVDFAMTTPPTKESHEQN
jgi:hypothetical protein